MPPVPPRRPTLVHVPHQSGADAGLRLALERGDFEAVRQALEAGADPNVTVHSGTGPQMTLPSLHYVLQSRPNWGVEPRTKMVRLLLQYGADPHQQTPKSDAWDPLDRALGMGAVAVARLLLRYGYSPNRYLHRNGVNPAHRWLQFDYPLHTVPQQVSLLHDLEQAQCSVRSTNAKGWNVWQMAIISARPTAVLALLERGVDMCPRIEDPVNIFDCLNHLLNYVHPRSLRRTLTAIALPLLDEVQRELRADPTLLPALEASAHTFVATLKEKREEPSWHLYYAPGQDGLSIEALLERTHAVLVGQHVHHAMGPSTPPRQRSRM